MKKWSQSEYFKYDILTILLCFVPMIIGACFYNSLPSKLPIHFNVSMEPNSYASKAFALYAIPGFLVILQIVFCLGAFFGTPKKDKRKAAPAILEVICRCIIPMTSIVIVSIEILYALNHDTKINRIIIIFIGVLFLLIGNYLPKCKQNGMIGYRLPWTMNSPTNWNKTHRFAGFIMVVCSIVLVVLGLLGANILAFITLCIMIIVPIVYSFILSTREN